MQHYHDFEFLDFAPDFVGWDVVEQGFVAILPLVSLSEAGTDSDRCWPDAVSNHGWRIVGAGFSRFKSRFVRVKLER